MKKILLSGLIVGFIGSANAVTVNFDDLNATNTGGGHFINDLATNYQGFTWDTNWLVGNNTFIKSFSGSTFDVPSLQNAVWNKSADPLLSLSNGTDFNFIGASFAGFKGYESDTITVNGYNNGSFIGTVSAALSTDGSFSVLAANLNGVDQLDFITGTTGTWLMDNFEYVAVPVPAAAWLFGSSLGLLGWIRRRTAAA